MIDKTKVKAEHRKSEQQKIEGAIASQQSRPLIDL